MEDKDEQAEVLEDVNTAIKRNDVARTFPFPHLAKVPAPSALDGAVYDFAYSDGEPPANLVLWGKSKQRLASLACDIGKPRTIVFLVFVGHA